MEYLVAILALLAASGYAVFIAVNIEKGKSWALEIAHAISAMDPNSSSRPVELRESEEAEEVTAESVEPERLAA